MTMAKKQKEVKVAHVPSKTSINLFIEEKHTGKNIIEILIFLVFMFCVALFSKFVVQGQLDEMNRLESNYHSMENEILEIQTSLVDYEEVRVEYSHYGNSYLNAEEILQQDREKMLDLIEDELLHSGALVNCSMSGNVATLTINSNRLSSVSAVVENLEKSSIVNYVVVSNAATKNTDSQQTVRPEQITSTMTIYFADASETLEDTEQNNDSGSNFFSEAIENVKEGTASDLAQTEVEGGAE